MIERKAAAAAMMIAVWAGPCRADECEDFVAKLGAEIPKLEASERAPADRSIVVKLKHPDAAELSLTCFNADAAQPPEFNAKWNSAWPPASFYDLVASVGAIIVSNSEPAVRSGAVLCAQRALTADHNSDVFDVNGAHFECTSANGVAPSTSIRISKLKDVPPPPQPQ